jgi:hypothetical protein
LGGERETAAAKGKKIATAREEVTWAAWSKKTSAETARRLPAGMGE